MKNLSIHYYIKIRIRLVIVNKMNWLVIQSGSLKGGCMNSWREDSLPLSGHKVMWTIPQYIVVGKNAI